jgi:DNA-binding MarR family transcriptional regulator
VLNYKVTKIIEQGLSTGKLMARTSQGKMEKTREDLLQKLTDQMFSVMRQIHHGALPHGPLLSPSQGRLLFIIGSRKEEGISVKELAETANVTPGAITQFADTLVKKDLVRREADPNDRRVARLKLTDLARNQFQKLKKDHLASATQVLDALSNDEIRKLIELLSKVSSSPDFKESHW